MLQTCGINVMIKTNSCISQLVISKGQIKKLMSQGLTFTHDIALSQAMTPDELHYSQPVYITNVKYIERTDDTYCFTEPLRHAGIFLSLIHI